MANPPLQAVGYAYRQQPLTLAQLQALAQVIFGATPVLAFAADPVELLTIERYDDLTALPLAYDFGHIFSAQIELRWKRLADDRYDALGLAEDGSHAALASAGMGQIGYFSARRAPLPNTELKHGEHERIAYVEYFSPLGAVQLTRYARPEKETADERI